MYIVSASLGPFCLQSIHNLLNGAAPSEDYEINIANQRLVYIEGKINEFQFNVVSKQEEISIGGEALKQQLAIPFAAAFQYLFSDADSLLSKAPVIMQGRGEYIHEKLFKTLGWGVLAFFFLILLVNFLLFSSFSNQYTKLEKQMIQNKDRLEYHEKLKKELKDKQLFIEQSGLLEPSRTSYYADKLAIDMPKTIRMTQMVINPVKRKAIKEDGLSFSINTIFIAGTCKKSTELNQWVKKIKEYEWVEEVSVLNYTKKSAKAPGEFELEIIYRV